MMIQVKIRYLYNLEDDFYNRLLMFLPSMICLMVSKFYAAQILNIIDWCEKGQQNKV